MQKVRDSYKLTPFFPDQSIGIILYLVARYFSGIKENGLQVRILSNSLLKVVTDGFADTHHHFST